MNGVNSFSSMMPGMTGSIGININMGNVGMGSIMPMSMPTDMSSLSSMPMDSYNGSFSNPFSNIGTSFSNLGMGSVPGFSGACQSSGSMFGGMMQQMQQQQQMMQMMMMMLMMMMQQQQNGFGNSALGNNGLGQVGQTGSVPSSSASPSTGSASTPSSSSNVNATNQASATNPLSGNDQKMAAFIDHYLQEKGSPAAGQGTGALMVKQGKENNVDPLILLAIAGQETQWGKKGIGVNGMLGVGAYDSNPSNATTNPTFAGITQQVTKGAQTFAKLRTKGGSSASDSVATQTAAVNKAGWATDQNWHNGVTSLYNQIVKEAQSYMG